MRNRRGELRASPPSRSEQRSLYSGQMVFLRVGVDTHCRIYGADRNQQKGLRNHFHVTRLLRRRKLENLCPRESSCAPRNKLVLKQPVSNVSAINCVASESCFSEMPQLSTN